MINIFNLFLLLSALWSIFVYMIFGLNYFYLGFGAFMALVISISCFYLRIINKKSELLYLSWGFYQYYAKLYCVNIVKQIMLQIKIFFTSSFIDPKTIKISLKNPQDKQYAFLFESTIDFMAGYSILETTPDYIIVGALNEDYVKNFSAKRIFKNIRNINDDSLI